MNKKFYKYHEAVNYLESIFNLPQPVKNDRTLYLKRLAYLLKLLGDPHCDFKYIHVGGTAGKGTVATMIQSILTAAGKNCGLYTSPHMTTTIERIKVKNRLISPANFVDLLEKIKPAADQTYVHSGFGRPSYYELLLTLAFLYFKKMKCEYVVLEVGLGGRNDATNIIPTPLITIINSVDFDHTDVLGKTLSEIAREKAGIIKPKTTFFTTASNHARVLKIFKDACRVKHAEYDAIKPAAELTPWQKNESLAVAATKKLGINDEAIKAGLKAVKLPCRFEIIQKNPLVILDGAHNVSKLKTVTQNLKNLAHSTSSGSKKLTYRKLYLIIALTNERNAGEIFSEIKSLADRILVTRYQVARKKCYPPLELAKRLKTKKPLEIFLDPQMALASAKTQAGKHDLILITGSFYLAGELRRNWVSEEKILATLEL